MSSTLLDETLAHLRDALTRAPEQIEAASLNLRAQLDQLRRRPASLSADQLQHTRRQLQELAELSRLRLHTARRLRHALHTEASGAVYGRRGQL
jgi:hypothetical protein